MKFDHSNKMWLHYEKGYDWTLIAVAIVCAAWVGYELMTWWAA